MAQSGSISVTWENALPASSNQNECSIATPRSNSSRAAALQETGKCTVPSCSGPPAGCWCSSCADAAEAREKMTNAKSRVFADLIVSPPAVLLLLLCQKHPRLGQFGAGAVGVVTL